MVNRVVLVGRMGHDPEMKVTGTGLQVCGFRIAVDRRRPNAQGERETDWIDITAWGKQAEFVCNYLGKGRLVGIDGRLQTRTWETKTGEKRKSYEVVAESVQGLDRPSADNRPAPGQPGRAPEPPQDVPDFQNEFNESSDEFDPFADA